MPGAAGAYLELVDLGLAAGVVDVRRRLPGALAVGQPPPLQQAASLIRRLEGFPSSQTAHWWTEGGAAAPVREHSGQQGTCVLTPYIPYFPKPYLDEVADGAVWLHAVRNDAVCVRVRVHHDHIHPQ